MESDELWISKQHLLFSSYIPIGLKGNVLSNGLTYAMPLPMIVFLGVKVDLLLFKAAETIPVSPGKILTLFLATIGMKICVCKVCSWHNLAMQISVPMMFCLSKYHKDIQSHKLIDLL